MMRKIKTYSACLEKSVGFFKNDKMKKLKFSTVFLLTFVGCRLSLADQKKLFSKINKFSVHLNHHDRLPGGFKLDLEYSDYRTTFFFFSSLSSFFASFCLHLGFLLHLPHSFRFSWLLLQFLFFSSFFDKFFCNSSYFFSYLSIRKAFQFHLSEDYT